MQERLVWYFLNQPASDRQKPYNERTLQKIIKLTISVKLIVLLQPNPIFKAVIKNSLSNKKLPRLDSNQQPTG